jgi:uncharacterized membrane protein YfcA
MFTTAVLLVAIASGVVAAISGFGIGSLLTPLLSIEFDTSLAVAAVSIPHFIATAVRLWLLRAQIDWPLLRSFGMMSAAGGLAGALLHTRASNDGLTVLFGALLVVAGGSQLSGAADRWRFSGWRAWAAGALSGMFGGLVGNQGGIRSAAMLGFPISRDQFVATGAAIALLVDSARMPVYLATYGSELLPLWPLLAVAAAGVVLGTLAGGRVLTWLSEWWFRRIVGAIVLALGLATLAALPT